MLLLDISLIAPMHEAHFIPESVREGPLTPASADI